SKDLRQGAPKASAVHQAQPARKPLRAWRSSFPDRMERRPFAGWGQGASCDAPWLTSEIEVVDIVLGEYGRRTEQNLGTVDDGEFAKLAGLHRSRAWLQGAIGHCAQHIGGRIAEIDGIPEDDRLHAVIVDIGLHGVRRREADDRHLAAL